jgi:hypothetical protein
MSALFWFSAALAAVSLGAAALGWMRPRRVGLTSAQAMLMLGAVGMVAGLAIDTRSVPLATFAAICAQSDRSVLALVKLHWDLLPWMHAGMWLGGLGAIPLLRRLRPSCRRQYCARLAQNVACSAWMTLGMSVGVLAAGALTSLAAPGSAAPMLAGMAGGMVWGMVASVALYRLYFRFFEATSSAASPTPSA